MNPENKVTIQNVLIPNWTEMYVHFLDSQDKNSDMGTQLQNTFIIE